MMRLKTEFKKMIEHLSSTYTIPAVSTLFLPPIEKGVQQKNAQFMAMGLEGGAFGISYLLLPDEKWAQYNALVPDDYRGHNPTKFALEFGSDDPVKEMISLAAINAICQHVMISTGFEAESSQDSMGLLSISKGDRIGMVGLFYGLVEKIKKTGADLIVIEKKERLIQKYPDLPITLDTGELGRCNKVLCTSTTVLNNSLDDVLDHCATHAFVSIVGPTAGYFPDPLFARGVDMVGGRVVSDGKKFLNLISRGQRWGSTTLRTCFQKETYAGIG